jgi:hypothetical protein
LIFFGGENFNISGNSIISVEVGTLKKREKVEMQEVF